MDEHLDMEQLVSSLESDEVNLTYSELSNLLRLATKAGIDEFLQTIGVTTAQHWLVVLLRTGLCRDDANGQYLTKGMLGILWRLASMQQKRFLLLNLAKIFHIRFPDASEQGNAQFLADIQSKMGIGVQEAVELLWTIEPPKNACDSQPTSLLQ